MENETAGEKAANIAFKLPERDKVRLKTMCAELGWTQQQICAAMVRVLVMEYQQDPDVVRALLQEAMK